MPVKKRKSNAIKSCFLDLPVSLDRTCNFNCVISFVCLSVCLVVQSLVCLAISEEFFSELAH